MRAPVRALIASGWGCLLVRHSSAAVIHTLSARTSQNSRTGLNSNIDDDDKEVEKINLIIVPLIAFAAFMIFLCMRCCHWNQKDFRDRGIIIEHHRKKHIAQGLLSPRLDNQRRLSCVPEQLMLLPLFLTGSARSELNKMVDPPSEGIMEKICESDSDDQNQSDSEPPSTDSEFDTPFPYQSPGRRRSSSVPPDLVIKGRFRKSRSSSIVDITRQRSRRFSAASAVSCRSNPQTGNLNHNPNLLSVTAELHDAPRSFSGEVLHSGDVTPESIVYPLPGDVCHFPSEIRITRDVSMETMFRDACVDTSDLYPIPSSPLLSQPDDGIYIIQHRKIAKVRVAKPDECIVPLQRKRRRCDDELSNSNPSMKGVFDYRDIVMARVHNSAIQGAATDTIKNLTVNFCDVKPFIDYNPFKTEITNNVWPNSSGNSFGNDSDRLSVVLPPLCLSPISSNSEYYRRLCSSEDSALAKSPLSELSTDDRSNKDTLSRESTLSPPPGGQRQLNGRFFLHSKNHPNMQTVLHDDSDDVLGNHVTLDRVDSGRYSDSSTGSSKIRCPRISTSEPRCQSIADQEECSIQRAVLS